MEGCTILPSSKVTPATPAAPEGLTPEVSPMQAGFYLGFRERLGRSYNPCAGSRILFQLKYPVTFPLELAA